MYHHKCYCLRYESDRQQIQGTLLERSGLRDFVKPHGIAHDRLDLDRVSGKAIPYGVYDIGRNQGWVSVGIDHDTAQFVVQPIGSWWRRMGQQTYSVATEWLITADAGGSNGYRTRLWKRELQRLADETGLTITVCHLPPGTSKWNKIEHRMFCYITQNWRGWPLIGLDTIVNLIADTRTSKELTIRSALDQNSNEKGIKITDEEMAQLRIKREEFHGEWNYSVHLGTLPA
jgi:hypothetical protein